MTFCPNCKQQDCKLFTGRNDKLYQLEVDLEKWGGQKMEKNNIVLYTAYTCNVCGNFFAIGETRTGKIGDDKE